MLKDLDLSPKAKAKKLRKKKVVEPKKCKYVMDVMVQNFFKMSNEWQKMQKMQKMKQKTIENMTQNMQKKNKLYK